MKPEPLKAIKKVEIWIEYDYPGRCQYHPSRAWLVNHGYIAEKAKTVEIANHRSLLAWRKSPVFTLLHELSHAYHDQVLGFEEPRIKKAFQNYQGSGKGEKVMRQSGHVVRHYALSNHKEYFAEMTEAYFWVNDYYPFVYGELEQVDPQMLKLLISIWGKK